MNKDKEENILDNTIETVKDYAKAAKKGWEKGNSIKDGIDGAIKEVIDEGIKDIEKAGGEAINQVRDWNNERDAVNEMNLQEKTVEIHKDMHNKGTAITPDAARELAKKELVKEEQEAKDYNRRTIFGDSTTTGGTNSVPASTPTHSASDTSGPSAPISSFGTDAPMEMDIILDKEEDEGMMNMGLDSDDTMPESPEFDPCYDDFSTEEDFDFEEDEER